MVTVLTGYGSEAHTTDADRCAAVAAGCRAAGVPQPPGVDEPTIARLRAALTAEAAAWAVLAPGAALPRTWSRPTA